MSLSLKSSSLSFFSCQSVPHGSLSVSLFLLSISLSLLSVSLSPQTFKSVPRVFQSFLLLMSFCSSCPRVRPSVCLSRSPFPDKNHPQNHTLTHTHTHSYAETHILTQTTDAHTHTHRQTVLEAATCVLNVIQTFGGYGNSAYSTTSSFPASSRVLGPVQIPATLGRPRVGVGRVRWRGNIHGRALRLCVSMLAACCWRGKPPLNH